MGTDLGLKGEREQQERKENTQNEEVVVCCHGLGACVPFSALTSKCT